MRNALAHVPKTQRSMVAAALRQAFLQPDRAQASAMLRHVAERRRSARKRRIGCIKVDNLLRVVLPLVSEARPTYLKSCPVREHQVQMVNRYFDRCGGRSA